MIDPNFDNIYDAVSELIAASNAHETAIANNASAITANTTAISVNADAIDANTADISDVSDALTAATTDSGWLDMTLAEGWTIPYATDKPQYRKIGNRVYLRGLVNGAKTAGMTIATLPTGYRPTIDYFSRWACAHSQTEQQNIEIKPDGRVNNVGKTATDTIGREFICFAGISYFVD